MEKRIIEKIRLKRESTGISQKEFAERIDMSQRCYGRIENGQTKLKVAVLLAIVSEFGVGAGEFVRGV